MISVVVLGFWLDWMLENLVLVMGVFMVFGVVGVIFYLNNQLMEFNWVWVFKEYGIEVVEKLQVVYCELLIVCWYKKMIQVVFIEKESDVMFDYNYDGICEFDNIFFFWWVGMFYVMIIIGVIYFFYYYIFDKGFFFSEQYVVEME